MLHGIGGRTVAEAKERMSHAEALSWFAYIEKRGSLNVGLRVEYGLARLMALMVNRTGGWGKGQPAKADDFLARADQGNDEEFGSLDDVAKALGAIPKGGKDGK